MVRHGPGADFLPVTGVWSAHLRLSPRPRRSTGSPGPRVARGSGCWVAPAVGRRSALIDGQEGRQGLSRSSRQGRHTARAYRPAAGRAGLAPELRLGVSGAAEAAALRPGAVTRRAGCGIRRSGGGPCRSAARRRARAGRSARATVTVRCGAVRGSRDRSPVRGWCALAVGYRTDADAGCCVDAGRIRFGRRAGERGE
jgi:hypothetical protein